MTPVLDTLGMFDAAAAVPEQIAVAADAATAALEGLPLPAHDDIANVVLAGVGVSGQASRVVLETAGPLMAVPVVVHQGYGIPNFVDASTLVVAVSYDGDAEETVEAAQEALEDGAHVVCVSRGGRLAELARSSNAIHLPVGVEVPVERAALSPLAVPVLLTLERVGFFPGGRTWIDDAVRQLSRRRDALISEDNLARRLALRLGRAFPIVYGGNGLGGAAAERWKAQFNENAKVAAFSNQVPELTHDEICGWGQDGDVTRQVFQLFLLRHDFEHPQVARRLAVVDELLDEVVGAVHTVRAEGEGMLAQLLDLALVGDFASLHAAAEQGVDPGPVPVLAEMESRVGAR
ncbi:MAG TPA: SIS domain-containing protein [Acidimicrobiales bacterium]